MKDWNKKISKRPFEGPSLISKPMSFNSLKEYIKYLEKNNDLIYIEEEIDTELEMARIASDMILKDNKAIIFKMPKGYDIPVAMNLFASEKRMAAVLGVETIEQKAKEIEEILNLSPPKGLLEKVQFFPKLYELSKYTPKLTKRKLFTKVYNEPDLDKLPILKCWPKDGGKFITMPLVITKSLKTEKYNVGMYRMQVFDKRTTGMHWHPNKVGAMHFNEYKEAKKIMPVAVAISSEPAVIYSATAPLPPEIDEYLFAGFIKKSSVELYELEDTKLLVPANSEIILEGYIDPEEPFKLEGPFGDHTGYYSMPDYFPVFHIEKIWMSEDPIYNATVVGKPPKEDCFIAKATERLFLPLIRTQLPEIIDINLPIEGIFHNLAFVKIKKTYPGQARKVINALWGLGQFSSTKIIAVFDENVNIQNISECLWRLGNNVDPKRDIIITEGPLDILDNASNVVGYGGKMGIDATKKLKQEGYLREWPDDIE